MKIPDINITFTDLSKRLSIYKRINSDNSTVMHNNKPYLIKAIELHKGDIIDLLECERDNIELFEAIEPRKYEILIKCFYVIDEIENRIYLADYLEFKKLHLACIGIVGEGVNKVAVENYYNENIKK